MNVVCAHHTRPPPLRSPSVCLGAFDAGRGSRHRLRCSTISRGGGGGFPPNVRSGTNRVRDRSITRPTNCRVTSYLIWRRLESTMFGEAEGRSRLGCLRRRHQTERAQRVRDGGGGGSRSATILGFSNDFENSMGSNGKKRQKAPVQVQNRYRRSVGVSSDSHRFFRTKPLTPAGMG